MSKTAQKQKTDSAKILEAILRRKKIKKGDVAGKMGVSYPTLATYFSDPMRMDGRQVKSMAKALKVKEREMQLICSGSMKMEEVEFIN